MKQFVPVRRVVTGVGEDGRSRIVIDGPVPRRDGGRPSGQFQGRHYVSPYQSRDSTAPISSASFPPMINAATFYWYFSYPLPAEAIARV